MAGYIRDHRKELDSDIWTMPPLYHRVWQYLKYSANYADAEIPQPDGSKLIIKKGQHLTTLRDIAEAVSWREGRAKKTPNPHTISKILTFMIKCNMIAIDESKKQVRGNRPYTLITLLNWDKYQLEEVTGNNARHSEVTDRAQGEALKKEVKEELNNNAVVVDARESINQLEDAFCEIHSIANWSVKSLDIECMRRMIAGGMPFPFIIRTMRRIHNERLAVGENIRTFRYYEEPITKAWEKEQEKARVVHARPKQAVGGSDSWIESYSL